MKNAVGREIPEEILKITGKEVFHGVHYYDGYEYLSLIHISEPTRH